MEKPKIPVVNENDEMTVYKKREEIQKEEVEEVKWFNKKELKKELQTNPEKFLLGIKKNIEMFDD